MNIIIGFFTVIGFATFVESIILLCTKVKKDENLLTESDWWEANK